MLAEAHLSIGVSPAPACGTTVPDRGSKDRIDPEFAPRRASGSRPVAHASRALTGIRPVHLAVQHRPQSRLHPCSARGEAHDSANAAGLRAVIILPDMGRPPAPCARVHQAGDRSVARGPDRSCAGDRRSAEACPTRKPARPAVTLFCGIYIAAAREWLARMLSPQLERGAAAKFLPRPGYPTPLGTGRFGGDKWPRCGRPSLQGSQKAGKGRDWRLRRGQNRCPGSIIDRNRACRCAPANPGQPRSWAAPASPPIPAPPFPPVARPRAPGRDEGRKDAIRPRRPIECRIRQRARRPRLGQNGRGTAD